MPPHWMGYIGTPDVKATTARAEELGAKVWVKLMEIPTVGTFSVIQDPQGAFFAAYSPLNPPPAPSAEAKPGDFVWHELITTDVDAAWAFYADLFGWEKTNSLDMGPAGIYQMFGLPSLELGGIYRKTAEMPGPPHWLYYVHVADLDGAVARVKANGGRLIGGTDGHSRRRAHRDRAWTRRARPSRFTGGLNLRACGAPGLPWPERSRGSPGDLPRLSQQLFDLRVERGKRLRADDQDAVEALRRRSGRARTRACPRRWRRARRSCPA